MTIDYVPLLQLQRDLYAMPRGRARFDAYIAAMTDPKTGDLALPLAAMNPMAREHASALLDDYLAGDADAQAQQAVQATAPHLPGLPGHFRVCLVLADDLKGGWTNRYAVEFGHRFASRAMFTRGWLVGLLWTSEPASVDSAVTEALGALHRGAWILQHGPGSALRDLLAQEGYAMGLAGCTEPVLEPDDLAYTREVIAPHLGATDMPTVLSCVFGDAAAHALGYTPRGLSERAGLAVCLDDFRRSAGPMVVEARAAGPPTV